MRQECLILIGVTASSLQFQRNTYDGLILFEQVYDKRPPPKCGMKYGAACRLEPNGLKAAEAIGRDLFKAMERNGVVAKQILMHDAAGESNAAAALRSSVIRPVGMNSVPGPATSHDKTSLISVLLQSELLLCSYVSPLL